MAESELITLARITVQGFNAGEPERYLAGFAPDVVYEEIATQRRVQGASAVSECWEGWRKAMPDVNGTITGAVADGDTAVLEVTWTGTQMGPLVGQGVTIPASGKRQVTRAAFVFTIRGNKIHAMRHYFDMMLLLQQLGVPTR